MASSLAQQLQQLSQLRGTESKKLSKGKPSLLFDFQKAADVDIDTIYNIASEGMPPPCPCRAPPRCRRRRLQLLMWWASP